MGAAWLVFIEVFEVVLGRIYKSLTRSVAQPSSMSRVSLLPSPCFSGKQAPIIFPAFSSHLVTSNALLMPCALMPFGPAAP